MATARIPGGLQSGLRSIKRDWNNNSSETMRVDTSVSATISTPSTAPEECSPRTKRLLAIQAALDEVNKVSVPLKESGAANLFPGSAGSKSESQKLVSKGPHSTTSRQTPSHIASGAPKRQSDAEDPPLVKKKRTLPDGYKHPADSEKSSKPTSFSRTNSSSSGSTLVTSKRERKKATEKPAPVFLSKEQVRILELVQAGKSVFYTGSAGTGKSVLLREIIKVLRKKHVTVQDAVAITASTGIAACNIGGVTIHSFAGIGLGVEDANQLATKIKKNKKAMTRWLRTKSLIIDEVSMVDGDLFDKLAQIGSIIRKKSEPFGGIQIIVTGDFFQLPPVMKGGNPKFAFEANYWADTIKGHTYNLTKVFRQKDQEFVDMLNEMRFGRLTPKSIYKFKTLSRPIQYDDGLYATELFPRREEVDRSNDVRMTQLSTECHTYTASDGGTVTDLKQREKMLANFMAPSKLTLKIDSQVMLIKNMDETLVNGSIGRVIRFMDPNQAKDESIPIAGDDGSDKQKKPKPGAKPMPVVEFHVPGGIIKEVLMNAEAFKIELPNGEVQASRTQIPLILAWAMSIHKSQGQTLERVKVDLGKVFEKGQAYVALSRATSLDGLQVLNFDANKVKAHPKVVEWSRTLQVISA